MTQLDDKALPTNPEPTDVNARKPVKNKYWQRIIADRLDYAKRETDSLLQNPAIRSIMADYGYDDEKINSFVAIYNDAIIAQNRQQREFGDKVGASVEFDKLFSIAKMNFSTIRKITKIALRDDAQKATQLGLYGQSSKSIGAIFDSMQTFYDNMIDDEQVCAKLAEFGFNRDKINKFRDNFIAARIKRNAFIKEDSEAVEATRIRDEKMAILDDWMMDYYTISKIAFAARPELSEQPQVMVQ